MLRCEKKSVKVSKILLLISLVIALIVPFTFQKIKKPKDWLVQKTRIIENSEIIHKIRVNKKPKVIQKANIIKKQIQVIEKPLHQILLPDFVNTQDIKKKKKQFFNFLRPTIEEENQKLLNIRIQLKRWRIKLSLEKKLSQRELKEIGNLIKNYKVKGKYSLLEQLDELLIRIDIVPTPLVLVQAANESGWGTSRFARIGLNFFGIWCFRPGCGMIPNDRNHSAKHEVAAFNSVDKAVKRYLNNINTNNAYIVLRTIRKQLRAQNQPLQPKILATGLLAYSERGTDYVLEIIAMIRHNRNYFNTKAIQAD
jgi:Bax protein